MSERKWTMKTAIEQIEPNYHSEGGPLKDNDAWVWIKEQSEEAWRLLELAVTHIEVIGDKDDPFELEMIGKIRAFLNPAAEKEKPE